MFSPSSYLDVKWRVTKSFSLATWEQSPASRISTAGSMCLTLPDSDSSPTTDETRKRRTGRTFWIVDMTPFRCSVDQGRCNCGTIRPWIVDWESCQTTFQVTSFRLHNLPYLPYDIFAMWHMCYMTYVPYDLTEWKKFSKLSIFNFLPILSSTHYQTKCGLIEITKIGGENCSSKTFPLTFNGLSEPTPSSWITCLSHFPKSVHVQVGSREDSVILVRSLFQHWPH